MSNEQIDFGHERDLTIDGLVDRVKGYYPDADFSMLRKAYAFAEKAHEGQKRSSGEKYIIHPLNVAATLVKLRMDLTTIIAGLLHDVVEDCDIQPTDIEKEFTSDVAQLVVGLTKISKIKFKSKEETQAENFRKMVVAMAEDIRVIIVKLADRMHNMRTLQYVSDIKQKMIAQETLDIYVPLASRLGINSVKGDLEDLCLRFLHPESYYRLAEKVAMKKSEREGYILEVVDLINEKLIEYAVEAEVTGRPKHFYSIYKKMMSRGVEFEQIHDILAFRILVNTITECYKVLGVIHSAFKPVPGRFKDYIAIPKVNNYQSLHTTVIGPEGERIEIQIRTHEMHYVAERGIAAHWRYKEGKTGNQLKQLEWVQELLEFNQATQNNTEILDVVKNELDMGGVFVFTPNGDVIELRYGSTPLDFAYAVHTDVGHHCVGAKVNGKMVPLKYRLKSGDEVEVLTNKSQAPTKDWLKIVKSTRAKSKIKQALLKLERDKNREVGLDILDKAFKLYGTSIKIQRKEGSIDKVLEQIRCRNEDDLVVGLGSGKFRVKEILSYIPTLKADIIESEGQPTIKELDSYATQVHKKAKKESGKDNAVIVDGVDDVLIRMGKCCNPIPGDPIVGFVTRGRGITIHTVSCVRHDIADPGRTIGVEWNSDYSFKHPVNIRVITHDKPGILSAISKEISNVGINIRSAIAKSLPDQKGSFVFEVEVKDYSELLKTISLIESMEEVIAVSRA
jgi:guanosine-3',5'-bis(diphosphate) 3'-pyrophosphohydrolase